MQLLSIAEAFKRSLRKAADLEGGHWITVGDEDSPLHGRHMYIQGERGQEGGGKILAGGGHSFWMGQKDTSTYNPKNVMMEGGVVNPQGSIFDNFTPEVSKNEGRKQKENRIARQAKAIADTYSEIAKSVGEQGSIRNPFTPQETAQIAEDAERVAYIPIEKIEVNPKMMQFKTDVNTEGVSNKLKGVGKWDALKAGVLIVWKSKDGHYIVADGHHRMELAKRLGQNNISCYVLDEKAGWSASDARKKAAETNIAQGHASIKDAAKFLRETKYTIEDLDREGIPLTEGIARDGFNIARTSDNVYEAFINDAIKPKLASAIGESLAADPKLQDIALNMFNAGQFKGMNTDSIKGSLELMKARGVLKKLGGLSQDQMSIFGGMGSDVETMVKVSNFENKMIDGVKKYFSKMESVIKIPEKLERKDAGKIAKQLGIEVTSNEDIQEIKDALKEMGARFESGKWADDKDITGVLDKILAEKKTGNENIDRWKIEPEDIQKFKEPFIDNYKKYSLESRMGGGSIVKHEPTPEEILSMLGSQPSPGKPRDAEEEPEEKVYTHAEKEALTGQGSLFASSFHLTPLYPLYREAMLSW